MTREEAHEIQARNGDAPISNHGGAWYILDRARALQLPIDAALRRELIREKYNATTNEG